MKKILFASLLIAFAAAPAYAADASAAPAKPKTAQQQRMTDCNAQAKTEGKAGADRKTFMSSCLKGDSAAAAAAVPAAVVAPSAAVAPVKAKTAQQQKMTSCNAEAKTKALKGAERKTFMSTCLKG